MFCFSSTFWHLLALMFIIFRYLFQEVSFSYLICDKIGWIGSQSLFPTLIVCTVESTRLFDYSVILLLIGRCNGLFCVWCESFYPMGTYQTRTNVVKENGLQNVPQEDSFRKTWSTKGSRRRNICEQCVSNRKNFYKLSLTLKKMFHLNFLFFILWPMKREHVSNHPREISVCILLLLPPNALPQLVFFKTTWTQWNRWIIKLKTLTERFDCKIWDLQT